MIRHRLAALALFLALLFGLYWQERQIYHLRHDLQDLQQKFDDWQGEDGSPDVTDHQCS